MATSDLQNELEKPGFKVDSNSEQRLCTAILEQLEDVSGDISALAVKWYVTSLATCADTALNAEGNMSGLEADRSDAPQRLPPKIPCRLQPGPTGPDSIATKCITSGYKSGEQACERKEGTGARHCQHWPQNSRCRTSQWTSQRPSEANYSDSDFWTKEKGRLKCIIASQGIMPM